MPSDGSSGHHRDIVFQFRDGGVQRINELNPAYMPLRFPILFPRGELGWQPGIPHVAAKSSVTADQLYRSWRLPIDTSCFGSAGCQWPIITGSRLAKEFT